MPLVALGSSSGSRYPFESGDGGPLSSRGKKYAGWMGGVGVDGRELPIERLAGLVAAAIVDEHDCESGIKFGLRSGVHSKPATALPTPLDRAPEIARTEH